MKISPSILDADFSCLREELASLSAADRIHLDIMDGNYVPNLSFGAPVFKKVTFPVETEAHLMVAHPEIYFTPFCTLGVKGITFHVETQDAQTSVKLLKELKSRGVRAGICVDGATHTDMLTDEILKVADQVLVMSVQAGFGGQKFMTQSLEKVMALRDRGFKGEIEVDGGVNLDNVESLKDAGVDIVVVGSFLLKNAVTDRKKVIQQFQKI